LIPQKIEEIIIQIESKFIVGFFEEGKTKLFVFLKKIKIKKIFIIVMLY
jgi:hypothetical protein